MPKKGIAYNCPPAKVHKPADLARFPEIQAAINVDHKKRMSDLAAGRSSHERAQWKGTHKFRNKGRKGG